MIDIMPLLLGLWFCFAARVWYDFLLFCNVIVK